MGGKSDWVLRICLAALGFNIFANYVLVRAFGVTGAALATGSVTVLAALAMLVVGRHFFQVRYPWGRLARVMVAASIGAAAGVILQTVLATMPLALRVPLVGFGAAGSLLGVSVALGLWHPEDRELLRRAWRLASGAAA
jgi:O-antigen/teichoic acid export membrane protein